MGIEDHHEAGFVAPSPRRIRILLDGVAGSNLRSPLSLWMQ